MLKGRPHNNYSAQPRVIKTRSRASTRHVAPHRGIFIWRTGIYITGSKEPLHAGISLARIFYGMSWTSKTSLMLGSPNDPGAIFRFLEILELNRPGQYFIIASEMIGSKDGIILTSVTEGKRWAVRLTMPIKDLRMELSIMSIHPVLRRKVPIYNCVN